MREILLEAVHKVVATKKQNLAKHPTEILAPDDGLYSERSNGPPPLKIMENQSLYLLHLAYTDNHTIIYTDSKGRMMISIRKT